MSNAQKSLLRFAVSNHRYRIGPPNHHHDGDGSKCGHKHSAMEIDVDDTPSGQNPAKIEVEYVHAVEEALVNGREGCARD